jgi:hypothetical protein
MEARRIDQQADLPTKPQKKEEFQFSSTMSFDEESLIFNDNLLTDSNNFPAFAPIESTGKSNETRLDTKQPKKADDNSLSNFCSFTNSSILTYEDQQLLINHQQQQQQQQQRRTQSELYENIVAPSQSHSNKNCISMKQARLLDKEDQTEPREYEINDFSNNGDYVSPFLLSNEASSMFYFVNGQ